ncbi:MAG: glycosyl hydrolase 53 family protein [Clostridia bacterium]|nr:glycosyl hydrolase 53 family protein [Clostridia bacterium]
MKKAVSLLCIITLVLSSLALFGCGSSSESAIPDSKIEGSSLYVKKVENLPEDFILGMDISSVLAEEASGVKYYDFDGTEQDLFKILATSGVTHIRVRVWNDPYDKDGNGYGGGNCDVDCACTIGARAAKYGMKLIVDFHYSDFWADPAKQMVPKAWAGMTIEEKTDALYNFTKESLEKMKAAGADIGMVTIGNETNGSICGEKTWFNMQYLFSAGSKATREVCPEALVALHFANPERGGAYADYAWRMDYYNVDYDVFASSYYPYWHGTLDNLATVLSEVAETYGKKVMVMETSYAFTPDDTDFSGNTISDGGAIVKDYPFTVQGQANNFRNIVDTIANKTKNGIGVVYWEGAWITVGTESWEVNHEIWEKYGSGWASSYAAEYDPNDAGKYYGGSAVDNQAFFDADGKVLESLRVYNLVRYGNEIDPVPDAIADTNLIVDVNGSLELPDKVNAVMTDDSKQAVDVTWDVTDAEIADMFRKGVGKYTVNGKAGDLDAHCYISLIEYNFLENDSFESGDLTGWTVNDIGGADELYVEDKVTDSLTGTYHMHFWSAKSGSVEFTLEQEVKDLPTGKYKFGMSIMGGDGGDQDIYIYVKIDGETAAALPLKITYYNEWDTGFINDINYEEGHDIAVGIYVKCAGEGNGAWGKIDDAMLNSMS